VSSVCAGLPAVEPRTNRNYTQFFFMAACVNRLARVFVNDNHIEAENKLCHWVRVTEKLSFFFSRHTSLSPPPIDIVQQRVIPSEG
jgi:hypothetical protein